MSMPKLCQHVFRIMRRNKLRTAFMIIGVTVSISLLMVVVAMGRGARERVISDMRKMAADTTLMVRPGIGSARAGARGAGAGMGDAAAIATLTIEDAEAIGQQVANVKRVVPVSARPGASVRATGRSSTTMVFGVVPAWQETRNYPNTEGRFISDEDVSNAAQVCVVGPKTAADLFGDEDPLGKAMFVENVSFRVVGILEAKGTIGTSGSDLDNRVAIPISTFARRVYNQPQLSQVILELKDLSIMETTARETETLLRERHRIPTGAPADFDVRVPTEAIQTTASTNNTLTQFLTLIAIVALAISGLIVTNIMLAAVAERRQEIGIRRALGARQRDIRTHFLLEAGFTAATGGLLGVVVGWIAAWILTRAASIPTSPSLPLAITAVAFAAVIGVLAGIYPAWQAARTDPIQALK